MVKRLFDVIVAAIALLAASPLLALLAVIVKATSRGPVFHRSMRVGRGGHPFPLLKLRSMVAGAAQQGPGITRAGDPRITRIGKFLRKSKLDELPQLINVLRGDMSLVGPRPEDPRYVAHYDAGQRRVLSVRPGITSAASVAFRNEEELLTGADWERTYVETILPEKLRIELDALDRASFTQDLRILGQTIGAVLRSR
jgi:lipopolysaccharide/colanic/teichoic acid biosynthesis glycosyltransferase